jgi:ABC-type phosphate transport system auxiliary subunit
MSTVVPFLTSGTSGSIIMGVLVAGLLSTGLLYKCTSDENDLLTAQNTTLKANVVQLEHNIEANKQELDRIQQSNQITIDSLVQLRVENKRLQQAQKSVEDNFNAEKANDKGIDTYLFTDIPAPVARLLNNTDAIYREGKASDAPSPSK